MFGTKPLVRRQASRSCDERECRRVAGQGMCQLQGSVLLNSEGGPARDSIGHRTFAAPWRYAQPAASDTRPCSARGRYTAL